MEDKILIVENKKEEKFLRTKIREFDFKKFTKREINDFVGRMKKAMKLANGIGLSANQIGLDMRVFVAQVPKTRINADETQIGADGIRENPRKHQRESAFYAIFNPEIIKFSKEKTRLEEGCLSIPKVYGSVERPEKLTLAGFDKSGKKIKIKAWGLLAKVFQHEMDHLNGKLFIDRADKIYRVPSSERLKERLKDLEN
ncbi:MAG: peptide deformylase [Patescibacteria group bacterium]